MVWNPDQYQLFNDHRLRPALDLIHQIPNISPSIIYDLGCGPGNVTSYLSRRWNEAVVMGIDNSAEMLTKAKSEYPAIEWQQSDIASFKPVSKANLIFSNAALHWLDDHQTLFPHLVAQLHAGGIFAVQMPNNFSAPSHQLLKTLAQSKQWQDRLGHVVREAPVKVQEWYYDLLTPLVENLNIWTTSYLQPLGGENAVLEWVRGTALLPFISQLTDEDAKAFENEYKLLLNDAYPRQSNGQTLYPFSRLFMIAQIAE